MIHRRDKWWAKELERINRAHAMERAELVAVIAHLSGRPLPAAPKPAPTPPDDGDSTEPIG